LTVDKTQIENIQKMKILMETLIPIISEYIAEVNINYNNVKEDIYSYYETCYQKKWTLNDLIFIIGEFHNAHVSNEAINKYSRNYIHEYIGKNINVFSAGNHCTIVESEYNCMIVTLQQQPIDKDIIILLLKHFIIMKINNLIEDYKITKDMEKLKILFKSFVFFHHYSTKNVLMSEIYSYIMFNVLGIDRTLLTNSNYYQYSDDSSILDKTLLTLL
jgi:hypothetical protein